MPLMLLALLVAAQPSSAEPPTEPEPELLEIVGEAGDFESEEEWEEDDEAWEEEEGEESESSLLPEECLLLGADARVFAYDGAGKVRLVLRYSSLGAVDMTVGYKLNGGKGSLAFPKTRRHLSRQGVLRLTEHLNEDEMEKVRAAGAFTVDMALPGAPRSCQRFFTKRLTVKRVASNQTVWSQPATGSSSRR